MLIRSIIDREEISNFFKSINTDDTYIVPERVMIPADTFIPTLCEQQVWDLLVHQKRTASGPDDLPYWLWREFAHYLAPIITKILNNSICKQEVPHLWKIANVVAMQTMNTTGGIHPKWAHKLPSALHWFILIGWGGGGDFPPSILVTKL